jgi:hypothetical protein
MKFPPARFYFTNSLNRGMAKTKTPWIPVVFHSGKWVSRSLTRISHQLSTAAADPGMSTALSAFH